MSDHIWHCNVDGNNADSHPHRKPRLIISFWVLPYIVNLGKRIIILEGYFLHSLPKGV